MTASRKNGDIYILRLDKGEEIIPAIKDFCSANNITAGIVSGIGAIENPTVGCYDLNKKSYVKSNFDGIFEITSLLGNISYLQEGLHAHLHITIAGQDCNIKGGHLLEGKIGLTGEIFIQKLDKKIERKRDEKIGLNIFDL